MRILALDLGTHCGWAAGTEENFQAGTWNLATPKQVKEWGKIRMDRRHDPRICLFQSKVCDAILEYAPQAIVFEDVQFATYTKQVQLWASFRAAMWTTVCNLCPSGILLDCVPVSTLKKFATGSGTADKTMMMAALFKQSPELKNRYLDDNATDAIWLLKWAAVHLKRI